MAPTNVSLPPMAKASIIGIWIETVLYGVNCVMYGLCMFILLHEGKSAPVRWTLVVMSTILFVLCTIYVGASLRQLLEAFIYGPTDVPDYSTLYWLNFDAKPRVLKGNLLGTLLLAEDMILIWRLYVVYMYNWRVIIIPTLLAAGCAGCAYAASAVATLSNNSSYSPLVTPLVVSGWVCGFSLNAIVTGGIAVRLWRMGRTLALGATSTNRFASSVYAVIESGAISAVTNGIIFLMLVATKNPATSFGMDVAAQLGVLAPLLIVVQVGQTAPHHITRGNLSKTVSEAWVEIPFRARQAQDSQQDLLRDARRTRLPSSALDNDV